MLGGTSGLNAQAFIPQSKIAVEAWGKLGNRGWNWEIMKPYYRKYHTFHVPSQEHCENLSLGWIERSLRGNSGPVDTCFAGDSKDPIPGKWVETLKNIGYPLTGDPFSGQATGPFHNPVTVSPLSKERSYAATAYYQPVKERPNLYMITGALVENILLEKTSKNVLAKGVKYAVGDGEDVIAVAGKEVILAAGTLQSPKILELSGIGPATLLQSHRITVYVDNPYVGENLQDHPLTGVSFEVKDGVYTMDDLIRQDPKALQVAGEQYQTEKTGALTSGGVEMYSLLPLGQSPKIENHFSSHILDAYKPSTTNLSHPAAQLFYDFVRSILESTREASASTICTRVQHSFSTSSNKARDLVSNFNSGNYFSISSYLLYPLSRGSVHIRSANPQTSPTIDPAYFSHPLDLEVLARHIQFSAKIRATKPLADLFKPDGRCSTDGVYATDLDFAKAFVAQTAISGWHCTSTCAMLPRDKGGVLDEKLIVHGTANLRVVDASSFPIIPGGNPQSTVYAVAERAADFIKERWSLGSQAEKDGIHRSHL